mgnify:CR=1 FL=1
MQRIVGLLVVVAATALAGCGSCGGSSTEGTEGSATTETSREAARQSSRAGGTQGWALAQRVPSAVHWMVLLPSWSGLEQAWPVLHSRLRALGGAVDQIEADLRATHLLDLRDVSSLRQAGIRPGGGLVLFVTGRTEETFAMTLIDDGERFMQYIIETIPGVQHLQPQEVQRERGATYRLLVQAEAGDEMHPDSIVGLIGYVDEVGFLVTTAYSNREAALQMVTERGGDRLADHPLVRRAATDLAEYQVIGYASQELGNVLEPSAEGGGAVGGLRVAQDRIVVRSWIRPHTLGLSDLFAAQASSASNPNLGRLVSPGTFALLRLTASVDALLSLPAVRSGLAELSEATEQIEQTLGVSVERDILAHLGPAALVTLSRMRGLAIIQALNTGRMNSWQMFEALGAIVALEVRDREALARSLERIAAGSGDRVRLSEEGSSTLVTFTAATLFQVNLLLTDRHLLLFPDRDRAELLQRLEGAAPDLSAAIRQEEARSLITGLDAQGMYIDIDRALAEPAMQALLQRVPEITSTLARAFASQLYLRITPEGEEHLRAELTAYLGAQENTP